MPFRPSDPARSAATIQTDFNAHLFNAELPEAETVGSRLAEFYLEPTAPTVLIVDDSFEVRNMIVWLLGRCGCRSIAAQDGLHAKAILHEVRPALVVSDLRMPECDGWELLAFCHERFPHLPVLLMSGDPLGSRPEIESLAAGFLAKPIEVTIFRSEISRLISPLAPHSP